MTQPSGWYDDPQDRSQLRYWDGVVWSSSVTPKVSPTAEQSNIGMPYGVTPSAARPEAPGSPAQGSPMAPGGYPQDQQQDQGYGQQGGQWPAYGQDYGQFPAQQGGWQSQPPSTTPDGVELASWLMRVGARLLDGLFTGLLALPFMAVFLVLYFVALFDWINDLEARNTPGSAFFVTFPWDALLWLFAAVITGYLIAAAYEVFFLSRSGATPGKKIVGISVRLRDRAGPPPMKTVLGRTACYYGFALFSLSWLNLLWPLWDEKKQALHDKAVGTNVVVGPQPSRDA